MLDTDMEALHENLVANLFGDLDADGGARNVEDTAGTTLIKLVRHALHDGGVDVNVDEIAHMEGLQVGGHMLRTLFPEAFLEEMARVCALSVGADHFELRRTGGARIESNRIERAVLRGGGERLVDRRDEEGGDGRRPWRAYTRMTRVRRRCKLHAVPSN